MSTPTTEAPQMTLESLKSAIEVELVKMVNGHKMMGDERRGLEGEIKTFLQEKYGPAGLSRATTGWMHQMTQWAAQISARPGINGTLLIQQGVMVFAKLRNGVDHPEYALYIHIDKPLADLLSLVFCRACPSIKPSGLDFTRPSEI